ncbi:DUF4153 domain-containing protein [Nocardioides marmoraquaticus]
MSQTVGEALVDPPQPLRGVRSLKLKLGLLVSVSVLVATVLATLGAAAVPAWLSIPVTVALALAVTQLLARGMTAPLRQMIDAARRMAAGDYDARVTTSSRDEVGELARAFSAMAGDLADVDRQRRELVGSVSHELRTPLTALTALLENLHDGVTRPDAATIAPALQQAERLGALVDDLLDLSRVDAGVTPLRRREVAMVDLLRDAAAAAAPVAAAREVAVEVVVEPDDLVVEVDPDRLHQAVANLLDNATRHAPAGGTVRVDVRRTPGAVRLDVADDGPGIDPADRDRVIERFGTAGTPVTAGTGGTGLGLAIVRWVAELHGGRVAVVEPPSGRGALVRLELPTSADRPLAPVPPVPPAPRRPEMTSTPVLTPAPTATPPGGGTTDELFGSWWPESLPGRPRVVLAALAVGVLAAVAVPDHALGLGGTLVLLAGGGVVWWVSPRRRSPYVVASALVAAGLALVPTLRDAEWIGVLGVLAAGVLVPTALTDGRTVRGVVASVLAWPLAGLRGMPWLGRSVRALAGPGQGLAVARTALASLLAALVFGLLFASADAVFGQWFRAIAPDTGDVVVARIFVAVAVGGVVLAAAYLALNPPRVEGRDAATRARGRRYEWLVPLLVVDAVFALFLLAQVTAVVGGAAYVERTTGFTYASYAREGFAQLTVATALTLVVLALAGRRADRDDAADRRWLRLGAGLLCALTLLVVGSAMSRMWLYTEAYGLTSLRLLVWVFEGWLALVVLALLGSGVRLRAAWVPRAAVLSGAVTLLALAVANPDGVVARVNVDRFEAGGRLDPYYLSGLSDDAVPALVALPDAELACALPDAARARARGETVEGEDSWFAANLGRLRADQVLLARSAPVEACAGAS